MKLREIVYLCLDELKGFSDDFSYTEEHIIFLITKFRAFLLKQRYSDIKKQVPNSNYQDICLELEPFSSDSCNGNTYLKSTTKVPDLMSIGSIKVSPNNSLDNYNICYVTKDRFKFTGNNKYLQNIIYCTLDTDNFIYLKSNNPQFIYLKKMKMSGIFEDVELASSLSCDTNKECDSLDIEFPLESALVPPLVELVIKELLGATYRPEDSINNSTDDLANLASFLRRNTKSDITKALE